MLKTKAEALDECWLLNEGLVVLPSYDGDPDDWLYELAYRARDCLGLEAELIVRKVHEAFKDRDRVTAWADDDD